MRIAKLAIVCALSALGLFGQAGTGTITGTVTDAAGAVVPGAAIEVRNADTNVAYPTVTTETGADSYTNAPSTYRIRYKAVVGQDLANLLSQKQYAGKTACWNFQFVAGTGSPSQPSITYCR